MSLQFNKKTPYSEKLSIFRLINISLIKYVHDRKHSYLLADHPFRGVIERESKKRSHFQALSGASV